MDCGGAALDIPVPPFCLPGVRQLPQDWARFQDLLDFGSNSLAGQDATTGQRDEDQTTTGSHDEAQGHVTVCLVCRATGSDATTCPSPRSNGESSSVPLMVFHKAVTTRVPRRRLLQSPAIGSRLRRDLRWKHATAIQITLPYVRLLDAFAAMLEDEEEEGARHEGRRRTRRRARSESALEEVGPSEVLEVLAAANVLHRPRARGRAEEVLLEHAAEASTLSLAVAYCLCCRRTDLLESLFSLLITARPPLITVKRRRGGAAPGGEPRPLKKNERPGGLGGETSEEPSWPWGAATGAGAMASPSRTDGPPPLPLGSGRLEFDPATGMIHGPHFSFPSSCFAGVIAGLHASKRRYLRLEQQGLRPTDHEAYHSLLCNSRLGFPGLARHRLERRRGPFGEGLEKFVLASEGEEQRTVMAALSTAEEGLFLLSRDDRGFSPDQPGYLGYMRGLSFTGLSFHVMDYGLPPDDPCSSVFPSFARQAHAVIRFKQNVMGSVPNSMTVTLPCSDNDGGGGGVVTLRSKESFFKKELHAHTLDFKGRAVLPSKKNMQLVGADGSPRVLLLLGKVSSSHYSLDFCPPLSPAVAMTVALSHFVHKLAAT